MGNDASEQRSTPVSPGAASAPRPPSGPLPPRRRRPSARQLLGPVGIGLLVGLTYLSVRAPKGSDESPAAPVSPEVSKRVHGLGAVQKVDSILLSGFDGAKPPVLPRARGGVLVSAANWAGGGAALVKRIGSAAKRKPKIPPLVVGIQEGGAYRAYLNLPPTQGAAEIGTIGSPATARNWSRRAAAALKRSGFDLNLAPVADVATPTGPLAGRTFSGDPTVATRMVSAAVRGCRDSRFACAVTHFPGAGAESQSTDEGPATVSLDEAALEQRDLKPFRAAFAAEAPAVVISNAFFAAFDPVTPGALSPRIATELLRERMGFTGLAISDDLSAGAIRGGEGAPEAAIRALAAGTDLIQISDPRDAAAARTALLRAVRAGDIPRARLDEAVGRVLELKRKLGLLPEKP